MPTDQVKLNLEIKLFIAVDFFPLRSAVDRKAVIPGLKLCGLSMALMCQVLPFTIGHVTGKLMDKGAIQGMV